MTKAFFDCLRSMPTLCGCVGAHPRTSFAIRAQASRLLPFHGRSHTICTASKNDLNNHDLLIVGSGLLGAGLGSIWKCRYPDARVVARTLTEATHGWCAAIFKQGPALHSALPFKKWNKNRHNFVACSIKHARDKVARAAPNILFCLPDAGYTWHHAKLCSHLGLSQYWSQ
jgi:hypothetical protein